FEQHANDIDQVLLELVERLPLRVGAGEAGDITDVQARVRTPLDHGRKSSHAVLRNFRPCTCIVAIISIMTNLPQRSNPGIALPRCSEWFFALIAQAKLV